MEFITSPSHLTTLSLKILIWKKIKIKEVTTVFLWESKIKSKLVVVGLNFMKHVNISNVLSDVFSVITNKH